LENEVKRTAFDTRQNIVAESTTDGWKAPHVSFVCFFKVKALKEFLANYNAASDLRIAFNTALIFIIVKCLKQNMQLNAHIYYDPQRASGYIESKEHIDINMPMLLPSGKMMAVMLQGCDERTLDGLQEYINEVMDRIKNADLNSPKILESDLLQKGSITISNMGAAIKGIKGYPTLLDIVSPQIFAIGIGPVYEDEIPICLAFDHRVVDFGDVAPFINALSDMLQDPGDLL
jgi:pyruvate dehydrogenase E2 component (dihydrolipoamide acetyltransferase)